MSIVTVSILAIIALVAILACKSDQIRQLRTKAKETNRKATDEGTEDEARTMLKLRPEEGFLPTAFVCGPGKSFVVAFDDERKTLGYMTRQGHIMVRYDEIIAARMKTLGDRASEFGKGLDGDAIDIILITSNAGAKDLKINCLDETMVFVDESTGVVQPDLYEHIYRHGLDTARQIMEEIEKRIKR